MSEDALKRWVDESVQVSMQHGYNPSYFNEMIARYGARRAMARLVSTGKIQSGLPRLKLLGLASEWSIEAGILKFPDLFTKEEQAMAKFRLEHADDPLLR
ncbi:hypothetical protein [Acetobacter pasteurianus]|uniref:hypothetical protein n=1 Tax=Acetobacter pasteurianus TaxID=438 RepID=UPI0018D49350|nr:hypothetical protein [Acetobacter pasteurianus]